MYAPTIADLEIFLPDRDFTVSRASYLALGGSINWEVEGTVGLELMLRLIDEGAYPGIRVRAPKPEPCGDTTTHAWDPSGVLLRFARTTDG